MMHLLRGAALSVALAGMALAQYASQEISGFVLDPTGAAVPRARIGLRHLSTGAAFAGESDGRGAYAFLNLQIGEYEITAEAAGFRKYVQTNVTVTVSARLTLPIPLTVGDVRDAITVTGGAPEPDAGGGEVGATITGEQAANLQLNGRSFAQLLALLPGVSTLYRSPVDLLGSYNSNNSQQAVNGSRRSTLSWNVDGADNKDNGGQGNVFVRVNVDAIAEFKVLTSSYSAEYGQNSGAVVNIALKSGTRDFHGSPYGFIRGQHSNGGWNLGGPIYIPHRFNSNRTRLFFFVSQDFLHMDLYAWYGVAVPVPAQRKGDFSGVAQPVIDPLSGAGFPGNIIPASRIDRNTSRLLGNIPAPNSPGKDYEYAYSYTTPADDHQFLQKVDYHATDKHRLAVHYMRDHFWQLQNQQALTLYDRTIPGTNASAAWTWAAGPRTVNTFQFSVSGNVIQQDQFRPNPTFTSDVSRQGNGIDNPMLYGKAWEIPDISIQGYNTFAVGARNWSDFQRVFQWKDDFSRVAGAHILKFGALITRSRKNQGNVTPVNGSFSFRTGHSLSSGNALADAVLGNFATYTEADGSSEGWFRFSQAEFYAKDNWKVSRRFSIDAGVRFQYMQPQYSALQNDAVFDPGWYDPQHAVTVNAAGQIAANSGDPANGLVLGGSGFPKAATDRYPAWNDPAILRLFRGVPKEIQPAEMPVAPRVGFAYDLTGKQRTLLRGAWGLFFERIQGNAYFSSINNPPFIQQATLYGANIENPAGGAAASQLPQNVTSYLVNAQIPTVQQYNLGIQQRLGRDMLLDIGYVGNAAWHLYRGVLPNQLPLGTMLRVAGGVSTNSVRPYPGFGTISQLITGSNSNYNSLQVQVRKQTLGGGAFGGAYTWSRNITDATDFNTYPQDSYHFKNERGLSGYHRAHILTANYVYPLPFWRNGNGWYRRALGNWQVSGIITLETGLPMDITAPGDAAGISGTGGSLRPDVIGDWKSGGGTWQAWFNTAAFRTPAAGTFGNLGRGVVTGPGVMNWDASFQKNFRIRERFTASFRLEYFNILNHMNYWGVDGSMASARFGQVTTVTDPRTLQIMLRVSF